MADFSVKERTVTPAEEEHKKNIADNYRKLRFDHLEDYNAAKDGESIPERVYASAPVESAPAPSFAAERIAQYRPVASPKGSHDLFEGFTYKDGTLYGPKTATEDAVLTSAPVAPTAEEAVLTSAPMAPTADDEDAVPTRRTMDTLIRPAAKTAEEEAAKPGLLSMLSTKTKLVLAAVCAVILLAIVLIGVNSGLIRSIDLDIANKQTELGELARETQSVREQIADLTSPESIAEWAARNNMVLGE